MCGRQREDGVILIQEGDRLYAHDPLGFLGQSEWYLISSSQAFKKYQWVNHGKWHLNHCCVIFVGSFWRMPVSVPASAHRSEANRDLSALSWILHRTDDPRPQPICTLQVSPPAELYYSLNQELSKRKILFFLCTVHFLICRLSWFSWSLLIFELISHSHFQKMQFPCVCF